MKDLITTLLQEHGVSQDTETISTIQYIVDKVYPHVVTNLGPSDYFDEIPPVELWKDIYARLSGIPGSMGEESESSKAQFDENTNKIFIYYPNMADEEDVIRSLLHEYTHHLQDPEKWEEYRAEGYDNNPYEIASRKAEENWEDYLVYLKDNLNESEEETYPEEGLQTREPFTTTEAQILNYLTKEFTWEELNTISSVDETQLYGALDKKWHETIKLFGEYPGSDEKSWIKSSRWAKWAIENWDEACGEGNTGDGLTPCDFKDVTNPVKSWPSWFEVDADESFWQKEYRSGTIELGAYDRDDAEERADMSWWEYDPDMDHYDYGDTDDHELETRDVRHIKTLNESIMDDIPLEQFREDNPEVMEILNRFPETLQRELAVERKNPQEFVEDFVNYYLNSPEPITISLKDELDKEHTIDTLSRTPQDVVDVINDKWGTDFESVKVFDPNPARYFEYANFPADTAKPSLMVDGEILYGVARFIAALLRGDETMKVWDLTQQEKQESGKTPQKDGYRVGSPFKDMPFIDVDSNRIDMNNLAYDQLKLIGDNGVEIIANNNSGTVIVPGAKKVREIPINEQNEEENNSLKVGIFTPNLIKLLRYIYALHSPENGHEFYKTLRDTIDVLYIPTWFTYIALNYNAKQRGMSIETLLNEVDGYEYAIPKIYDIQVEYYGNYESYMDEDECGDDGYGIVSGEDCECYQYEDIEVTREDDDGEKYEEYVPCNEAEPEEREAEGFRQIYDCPCEQWEDLQTEYFYYNKVTAGILSTETLDWNDVSYYYDIEEVYNNLGPVYEVVEDDTESLEDDRESWQYFDSNKEGEVLDIWPDGDYSSEDVAAEISSLLPDASQIQQVHEQDSNNTPHMSPDLKVGDRVMVWDLTADPKPPGEEAEEWDTVEMPRTMIATVIDALDDDEIDREDYRGGIQYMVRDESNGEEYGLYGGWGHMYRDGKLVRVEQRDKWVILPPKETTKIEKMLNESGIILPDGDDAGKKPEIPEVFKKLLVLARFERPGGWGRPSARFLLYITPGGKIVDIRKSASVTTIPFKINDYVKLSDLIKFEEESGYSVQMKGRLNESNKILIRPTVQTQYTLKLLKEEVQQDEIDRFLDLAKSTKQGWMGGAGRKKVFDFLNVLRDSGLVNMFQATDFLWSGSRWLTKYLDLHHPEYLEPIDEQDDTEREIQQKEKIQYLIDNADGVRDVVIANVLAKAELKGDTSLEGANRLMRPSAQDMVKLWANHIV